MDLYNGKISEFVDWVTGKDTSEEEVSQNPGTFSTNKACSGGSIRELLQRKLKTPFVVYEDKAAGLYRLFSSDEAKYKYLNLMDETSTDYNPELAAKFELFNFERPGDTTLVIGNITGDARYIINGDSTSEDTKLAFSVMLKREKAGGVEIDIDGFTVTYTIKDSTGKETVVSEEFNASECSTEGNENIIVRDMYQYLKEGTNQITLAVKARNSSASSKLNIPFYLVNFELSSTFPFAEGKDPNKLISIPFRVKRSIGNLTLTVKVSVDGNPAYLEDRTSQAEYVTNSSELDLTNTLEIANIYKSNTESSSHIKHLLKLEAIMSGTNSRSFMSNVIFFEFETASSTVGIVNKFVNIKYSIPYNKIELSNGNVILRGTQYEPFNLNWGYYTDQTNQNSIQIQWGILKGTTYKDVSLLIGNKGTESETLTFIPDEPLLESDNAYLVAKYNDTIVDQYRIIIDKSSVNIQETSDYNLKLSAYGKSNSSNEKNIWKDFANNKETTFSSGVTFDNNNGWNQNSLILQGEDSYATINYCPFPNGYSISGKGKTIEIEFKSENINDNDDIVISIGGQSGAHIDITPNSASLYVAKSRILYTKFKSNELIKLAFVFNPISSDRSSNLIYIVNNGILERAADMGNTTSYIDNSGMIKLGGSQSGIRIYTIRAYDKAIGYNQELNNYIYDSNDKSILLSRNDILVDGVINYERCKNKIDTILIEGDLSRILNQDSNKENSESTVDIERICVSDPTKSFKVKNGMIRKHGQSTLNYPITSYKIWLNKSASDNIIPSLTLSDNQKALGLNKNRYIMKTGAIPSNKFVLQANYADSSGVHNGGLERLIQDCWYNAEIDGQYRLRTEPQLFASGETIIHNDSNLNDTGWVEGNGENVEGKVGTWKDFSNGKQFPYNIRISPDSFPCAVFYRDTSNTLESDTYKYLGQFVFMDDKKSDFLYGERSIYAFGNYDDPFVLKTENTKNGAAGKQDTKQNRVWDNSNVLRIEDILVDNTLVSFMDYNVPSTYSIDEDGNINNSSGQTVPCDSIKYDEKGNPLNFYWEDHFEVIYPDDIEEDAGMTKFSEGSKFRKKTQPFLDFLKWITDIGQLNKVGDKIGDGYVTQAALNEFIKTAHEHLDLYKVAAYYIFFLRFGLVDSVERNNQYKTYDGKHWHCEPWDMDIATGNRNQGGNTFDPPMTRDTRYPDDNNNWAFSGRSSTTSNVLWDCLEEWEYWRETVVPKVAQALYKAGLTYENITKMFDNEYASKWSEIMYNESGYFKYIKSGGADWLEWLQGARTSHRHWWISTSMNYYDAKWSCGSFNSHDINITTDKEIHEAGTDIITITPNADTFFKVMSGDNGNLGTKYATREQPAVFDVSTESFTTKNPVKIYGANFIEELDLSSVVRRATDVKIDNSYDEVLGAPIRVLNIGVPFTSTSSTQQTGHVSGISFKFSTQSGDAPDAGQNLRELNIRGQWKMQNVNAVLNNRKNIKKFYAAGSNITAFSCSGNNFDILELPGITTTSKTVQHLNSIKMSDSNWKTLQFWDATIDDTDSGDNSTVLNLSTIPADLGTIEFEGSTASNNCAKELLLQWIDSIEKKLKQDNPDTTEEDLYQEISKKQFRAENINWSEGIYYKDLERIAHLNNGNNQSNSSTKAYIRGYIMLSDEDALTPAQLTNIRNWFGDSVFDKSSMSSGLVVDQNTNYIQITVGNAEIDGDTITLNEPNAVEGATGIATLYATKFILGDDVTKYTWSLQNNSPYNNDFVTLKTDSEDGIVRLIASQSTHGDYFVIVRVSYVNDLSQNIYQEVKINIHGVTYPDNFKIYSDNNTRVFNASEETLKGIFGINNIKQDGTLIDTYVFYKSNLKSEFYLKPTSTGFTATINSIEYAYYNYAESGNGSGFIKSEILSQNDSNITTIGTNGDDPLAYTKDSTNNGISLKTISVTDNMSLYRLIARVSIGGRDLMFKYANIIVINDSTPVLQKSSSNALFLAISNKYANDFSLAGAYFDFYKTHLMSMTGELSFVNYKDVSTFATTFGDTIFKYVPNLTSLIFDGCTNNILNDSQLVGDANPMNFDNINNLTSVSMNNCVNTSGTLTISNVNVSNVDLRGTNISVEFAKNSKISTLYLGKPISVKLDTPINLTDITIESSENLEEIELIQVDTTTNHGFNVFNILTSQ